MPLSDPAIGPRRNRCFRVLSVPHVAESQSTPRPVRSAYLPDSIPVCNYPLRKTPLRLENALKNSATEDPAVSRSPRSRAAPVLPARLMNQAQPAASLWSPRTRADRQTVTHQNIQ